MNILIQKHILYFMISFYIMYAINRPGAILKITVILLTWNRYIII